MVESKKSFLKNTNITALIFCAAGIGLNMAFSYVTAAFSLPLYLDTVGTVTIAVLGGYLPGVIVGFATNIIKTIIDPPSLYYGVLNVLIAFFAAFLAGRGWHKKIRGMLGMILIFTLIGGGIGALIPMFMEGLTLDSASLSGALYQTGLFGLGVSQILSSLIMDLPDKAITVILVIIIIRLIPEKYYRCFSFTGWQQNPAPVEKLANADKTGVRRVSFQTKILLALGTSLITVALAAIGIGMVVYDNDLVDEHSRIAKGTARIAAAVVDGNKIGDFLEKGETAEGYPKTKAMLQEILDNSPDVSWLYVLKIDEEGNRIVFDMDTGESNGDPAGTVFPHDRGFSEQLPALLNGEEVEPVITNDEYGYLLTAYHPVYDSKGECVCYVGVDVDMNLLAVRKRSFCVEMASVFLSFFFLICVLVIWLARYHVIIPVNSIMRSMNRFTRSSDTQERMDEDVRLFRDLQIRTGDEVEKLYLSACAMTKNQAEQMRSIRRLSDSTAKMQDGMIITMADLVESRDSETGAHVQKTAAYVKIIAEGLKKKGYYPEKVTPKFISDVVRSAPLHDVGKINVPDRILNKPGKLTEEEYEIMKTHTTEGKRIMENAISTVKGDNYLKEARNMAAYHHERWDGNGYPEGLHGEVIPLSARIMAIADVFDALTSGRVYKPAFTLEEALSILEEGKGTQFDPKCVEVFEKAVPEVKVILKKYNE